MTLKLLFGTYQVSVCNPLIVFTHSTEQLSSFDNLQEQMSSFGEDKIKTRRMAIANGMCVTFCTFWPPLGMPLGQLW